MTTMDRSLQQRLDALAIANPIRTKRAQLKRDIAAGRAKAADVILDPPEWAQTMKAYEVVRAVPKIGKVRAAKIMYRAGVSQSRTLGGLPDRRRRELAALLGGPPIPETPWWEAS